MGLTELKKQKHFLHLLLNSSKNQAQALFYTLTPQHTKSLCEIIYNLKQLPVPVKTRRLLLRRRKLIEKLTSDKKLNGKLRLLQNHYRQVHELLLSVDKQLLKLVT